MVRNSAPTIPHHQLASRRKRKNRRKINKLRLALGVAVAVLLGECVAVALASPRFHVKGVALEGMESVPAERVAEQFAVPPTQNIFLAPTRDWERAIQRLPGVAKARIQRKLPGTLAVEVTERKPWASVRIGQKQWLTVDENLVPFRSSAAPEAGLMRIVLADCAAWEALPGIALPSAGLETARECVHWAGVYQKFPVKQIEIDADSKVCLVSQGGVLVKLGSGEKISEKLTSLEKLLLERPDLKGNASNFYINLFAADAPAVGKIVSKTPLSPKNSGKTP